MQIYGFLDFGRFSFLGVGIEPHLQLAHFASYAFQGIAEAMFTAAQRVLKQALLSQGWAPRHDYCIWTCLV